MCGMSCGLEVRVDENRITKVRGDRGNPVSRGYTCSKGLTVAKYAHHLQRVTTPLKQTADGTHAPFFYDPATTEIAAKLNEIIARSSPRAVALVGGGGQANHLDFAYASGFLRLLGSPWHYNALAQEFTQKYWVNGHVFGSEGIDYGDNAHASEVLLVLGSNPWMSHGIQRARVVLKKIAKDPGRSLIVVDPRRHETARKADHYLQIRPGTDLFFLLAMVHVIVHEGLADESFIAEHTRGWEGVKFLADLVTPARAAALCDLDAQEIVTVARRFATARSASIKCDLGIYHSLSMVENCYLVTLLQIITGNLCTPEGAHFPTSLFSGGGIGGGRGAGEPPRTRVAGIPAIRGLFPPNALPEEILDAGPERIRALFVEACNPLCSYADTPAMTRAFRDLELLVVIDPAMTEAARLADYVLPAPVGYEKWEASSFPKGWPDIHFQLRPPVLEAPPEARQECLIFYEIARAMGLDVAAAPVFRALGAAIEAGAPAPVLSLVQGLCHAFAGSHGAALVEAETVPDVEHAGPALFQKLLEHPQGLRLCRIDPTRNWQQVRTEDHRAVLDAPEILERLREIRVPETPDFGTRPDFPFVLQTGERSDYNANTIQRDPTWRKKQRASYLRMHETVARDLDVTDGETVRLVTEHAEALVPARVTDDIYPGNLSMPHGYGLLWENEETGVLEPQGVNVQALVSAQHRDPLSGVPYHKYIPARVEKVTSG
jgi:anaerobic selenocysteine-containing dehydrogenase